MPDIHHLIRIAAPIDRIDTLVSTGGGFREWWADDVEPVSDGLVSLGFFDRTTNYRLRLLDHSSGKAAWRCESGQEWEGTDLVFTLTPGKADVALDFVHANWRDATPYFLSCNTTWGGLMFRLKNAAEGRRPGPLFARDSVAY
jgi:hypothetical protein